MIRGENAFYWSLKYQWSLLSCAVVYSCNCIGFIAEYCSSGLYTSEQRRKMWNCKVHLKHRWICQMVFDSLINCGWYYFSDVLVICCLDILFTVYSRKYIKWTLIKYACSVYMWLCLIVNFYHFNRTQGVFSNKRKQWGSLELICWRYHYC